MFNSILFRKTNSIADLKQTASILKRKTALRHLVYTISICGAVYTSPNLSPLDTNNGYRFRRVSDLTVMTAPHHGHKDREQQGEKDKDSIGFVHWDVF